jgi:hypothetical protein
MRSSTGAGTRYTVPNFDTEVLEQYRHKLGVVEEQTREQD